MKRAYISRNSMKLKEIYEAYMIAAYNYAKWEHEVAREILSNKKKVLLLGLMVLPIIIVCVASATSLPAVLGGKKAYAPISATPQMFEVALLVGLCAGLITGCIGAGGGFVITPALMSAGVRGIVAVGTDLFHIFAKSIMGTAVHKKLGNVSIGLSIAFCIGSIIGVQIGGTLNRIIYYSNPVLSDAFISIVYVLLLGFLGIYALKDYLKLKKLSAPSTAFKEGNPISSETLATTRLAIKLQSIRLPPMISFDHDLYPGGKSISAWFVMGCGLIVGFVAAIMGVGGGFLIFPMYVYLLGVSSFTTVGTSLLQIIITAGYASIVQYAIYGFVFYTLAMGLLLGSLVGIQIGSLTTKVVKGLVIRGFYAIAILAGFLNRLLALPSKLTSAGVVNIDKSICYTLNIAGIVIFYVLIGIFAAWVLVKFLTNIKTLREV